MIGFRAEWNGDDVSVDIFLYGIIELVGLKDNDRSLFAECKTVPTFAKISKINISFFNHPNMPLSPANLFLRVFLHHDRFLLLVFVKVLFSFLPIFGALSL